MCTHQDSSPNDTIFEHTIFDLLQDDWIYICIYIYTLFYIYIDISCIYIYITLLLLSNHTYFYTIHIMLILKCVRLFGIVLRPMERSQRVMHLGEGGISLEPPLRKMDRHIHGPWIPMILGRLPIFICFLGTWKGLGGDINGDLPTIYV